MKKRRHRKVQQSAQSPTARQEWAGCKEPHPGSPSKWIPPPQPSATESKPFRRERWRTAVCVSNTLLRRVWCKTRLRNHWVQDPSNTQFYKCVLLLPNLGHERGKYSNTSLVCKQLRSFHKEGTREPVRRRQAAPCNAWVKGNQTEQCPSNQSNVTSGAGLLSHRAGWNQRPVLLAMWPFIYVGHLPYGREARARTSWPSSFLCAFFQ